MLVGYKSDPRVGVKIGWRESSSLDFALRRGGSLERTLSVYSGKETVCPTGRKALLPRSVFCLPRIPESNGRDAPGCGRLGASRHYMRDRPARALGNHIERSSRGHDYFLFDDTFGVDSKLRNLQQKLPDYKETLRPFSDEAMKISYGGYNMPGRIACRSAPRRIKTE